MCPNTYISFQLHALGFRSLSIWERLKTIIMDGKIERLYVREGQNYILGVSALNDDENNFSRIRMR